MRIFLSFHSKDQALADALRVGLNRLEPKADIFFSPVSLGAGLWQPKLAEEIATADAFLFLIGPGGVGPWQDVEYNEAFDRHVHEKERFPLVPVIAASAKAPGLPFLRRLKWVEAPVVTEDRTLHRVIAALRGESVATATPLWKLVNPYRGLEAMTEANADYFYGRAAETAAVLTALAEKRGRCPILIGASGVGKSSVARAGVLSALKSMQWPGSEGSAGHAWPAGLKNSRTWLSLVVRPGEAPLESLAAAFTRFWQLDERDPDHAAMLRKWAERLASGNNRLADLINTTQGEIEKRAGEAPERVLLYLDQGEELYTRAAPREARRFSEILAEGLGDRRLSAFASLRADYFDQLQADEPLFKCRQHVDVPPLDRAQLHEVVAAPARVLEVSFEDDRIADRITEAAAAEQLPLLSYLLHDMWDGMVKRGDATLRLSVQVIDVGGVLKKAAEDFLAANPAEEAALRRLLTLRLATVPPEGEPVRRQSTRAECSAAEWALASRLAEHPWRLVVMRERAADGQIVAEVAHEAFLRAWPRLRDWLRDERDFLVVKSEAERAQRRWREIGESDKALLTGLDLIRAEECLPTRAQDLSDDVVAFVQRSIRADRMGKERQLRFQRRVTSGAVAATLIMIIIIGFAGVQWAAANRSAAQKARAEETALRQLRATQVTESLFFADLASQQRTVGDAGTALLLALEALPTAAATRPYVPEAEFQLDAATRAIWERLVIVGHNTIVLSAAFSPDGKRIVTASADKTARLWDAETGKPIGDPLYGHERPLMGAAFSPDGKRIVTASLDSTARLWDVESGQPIGEPLRGHESGVSSAAFSPDGKRIVTASQDRTARLWDAETGKPIGEPLRGHEGPVVSAEFSPDGKRIVTSSDDNTARRWDAVSGQPIGEPLRGHEGPVVSAEFSPDGKRIVTASWDSTARLWDAETGEPIGEPLREHKSLVSSAAFSPDGKRIVTASQDKTARLWDAETGKPIGEPLRGHEKWVERAVFGPDGKRIVTASDDNTARLWDAVSGQPIGEPLRGHEGVVLVASFSPDGKRIFTACEDKPAQLWDAENGQPIGEPLRGHAGPLSSAAFSPDGKRIVTASQDTTARRWDAETGKPIGEPLRGHESGVSSAAFSPDGKRIVTASADRTAKVWDVESGQPIGEPLRGHEGPVVSAEFSPDGKRIVTASEDKTARLWHAETGKPTGEPLRGHEEWLSSAAFSPDGKRIVTSSDDNTARLWDAETGKPIGEPLRATELSGLRAAFSPDGKRILTSGGREVRLWDAESGRPIGEPLPAGPLSTAAFSLDGKRIVTASLNNTGQLWDAESGKPIAKPLDPHGGQVSSAAFSTDGKRIITASDEDNTPHLPGTFNTIRLWSIFPNTQAYVTYAKAIAPRCLSQALRKQFFLSPEPPAWCIEMEKWPYHTAAWKQWLADTRTGKNPQLPEAQ